MIGHYSKLLNEVIQHSQEYPFDVDTTPIIEKWYKNKQHFIQKFGGKTFIRSPRPVQVFISEDEQSRKFREFIAALDGNSILTDDFKVFLHKNKDGFFNNRVIVPDNQRNIRAGDKLVRAFRKFVGEAHVQWAQDMASMYIQENKITGYLYLSVDPLDYITMSENNSRWWSCHSHDGDYRAGALSYMVDETTLVAYVASDEQEKLKCGCTWNNKRWRMLVHVRPPVIAYYSKQYPFQSPFLQNSVHLMVNEILCGNQLSNHLEHGMRHLAVVPTGQAISLENNYLIICDSLFDARNIVDYSEYCGYCDLVHSTDYVPVFSPNLNQFLDYKCTDHDTWEDDYAQVKELFGIKVGGTVPCVVCGKDHIHDPSSYLCAKCMKEHDANTDFFMTCDWCAHHIYAEDHAYWRENKSYCKKCYFTLLAEEEVTMEDD